ncbi:regulator of chromosome condensation (RCC1) repeat domain-containing protein [Ditylenchus destructor]|uniref:Regulator of chromosome condensation (RCC1) repeat domain-containing protein n=1 Tax=Ditylenchus destructor TaxID=166010 RepID=A0AAD4NAD9_9BILA|nr:regulator of chromosome condensation (RCC1) repeat domain-containing protein [Ditylenchus destructor]
MALKPELSFRKYAYLGFVDVSTKTSLDNVTSFISILDNFSSRRYSFVISNKAAADTVEFTDESIFFFVSKTGAIYAFRKQICAGHDHLVILDDSGKVYTCGSGNHGELGHGSLDSLQNPLLVESFLESGTRIVDIAAGGWHSCALTGYLHNFPIQERTADENDDDDFMEQPHDEEVDKPNPPQRFQFIHQEFRIWNGL